MVVVTLMGTIFYDYDILYVCAYASYEKDERESIIYVCDDNYNEYDNVEVCLIFYKREYIF